MFHAAYVSLRPSSAADTARRLLAEEGGRGCGTPTYGDTAACLDVPSGRVRRISIASAPEKLRAPTAVSLR